jgi:hypothetical protein
MLLLKKCVSCEFTDELAPNKEEARFSPFWFHYWKNGRGACPECGAGARTCYIMENQNKGNDFSVAARCPKCGWFHDETEMVLNQEVAVAM